MSAAVLVAILVGAGVYLIFQRGLVRVAFGLILVSHAANVVILAAGGMDRREPAYDGEVNAADMADPLLQAFTLTAIVITFALTVYLLGIAAHGGEHDRDPADAEPAPPAVDADTVNTAQPRDLYTRDSQAAEDAQAAGDAEDAGDGRGAGDAEDATEAPEPTAEPASGDHHEQDSPPARERRQT